MNGFFKTIIYSFLMIVPVSTTSIETTPSEVTTIDNSDAVFNTDYSKYDELVKDIPAAQQLIDMNKKMDKAYKLVIADTTKEVGDATQQEKIGIAPN